MRNYHIRRNHKFAPIINLDKLWTLVTEQTRIRYKDHPEGKAPIIDCVRAVSSIDFIFVYLYGTSLSNEFADQNDKQNYYC